MRNKKSPRLAGAGDPKVGMLGVSGEKENRQSQKACLVPLRHFLRHPSRPIQNTRQRLALAQCAPFGVCLPSRDGRA